MYANQINKTLKHVKGFKGVYAFDEIEGVDFDGKFTAAVINQDSHEKAGSHWFSTIYIKETKSPYYTTCYFIDSLGRQPDYYQHSLTNMINQNSDVTVHLNKRLQSLYSSTCGEYCCMFVILMSQKMSYSDILNYFSSDTSHNDEIVDEFMRDLPSVNYVKRGMKSLKALLHYK